MSVKFPDGIVFFRVTISVEGDVDPECINELEAHCKKLDYCIMNIELGNRDKKHVHIVVKGSQSSNVKRPFIRIVQNYHSIVTGVTVQASKFRSNVARFVSYQLKEGNPVVLRGFKQTWIDTCVEIDSAAMARKYAKSKRISTEQSRFEIESFIKKNHIEITCYRDVKDTMRMMFEQGYEFRNPKAVVERMKMVYARYDPRSCDDWLNGLWNLM